MLQRHNYKWTINESLQLEREYDLLKWSLSEMAKKHKRSEKAIAFRLYQEGIIYDISEIYSGSSRALNNIRYEIEMDSESDVSEYLQSESESETESETDFYDESEFESNFDSESDTESIFSLEMIEKKENNKVTQRVNKLESSVTNMEGILNRLYTYITSNASPLSMGYE